jgi:hypothetical protein
MNGASTFLVATFAAGIGQPLTVGNYANAERHVGPGHPGLDVSANGRGCNNARGGFEVLEISYDGPAIRSLAIGFEYHCEYASPALFGSMRVNSTNPIDRSRSRASSRQPGPASLEGRRAGSGRSPADQDG